MLIISKIIITYITISVNRENVLEFIMDNKEKKVKLLELKSLLEKYETQLAFKMKTYRGVIHESALSELKHSEVMVLRAMVNDLKREIYYLEKN